MAATLHKLKVSVLSLAQPDGEESGRSVHQRYRKRVRAFQDLLSSETVAEIDLEGPELGIDDELGDLFKWTKQEVVNRAALVEQLTEQRKHADSQAHYIEQLLAHIEQQSAQIKQLKETVAQRESKLDAMARKRQQQQADHADELARLATAHAYEMRTAEKQYNSRKQALESDRRHIQAQLLVSPDKSYAWPDEKLRVHFLEVCRLLNNATADIAKSVVIPAAGFGRALDPDDTFGVVGARGAHFWLRSRVWAVVEAGFFSRPLGFGAFGPEKGARELMEVFGAWMSKLERPEDLGDATDALAIFRTDETANRWRSVTFQSLSNSGSVLAEGRANAERVADQLHALLAGMAAVGNATPPPSLHSDLRAAASVAFELALQGGINPAVLSLLSTPRGDSVVLDAARGFQDCEDGGRRGQSVLAMLVVQPGLVRAACDGRGERRAVIVPCEVFTGE